MSENHSFRGAVIVGTSTHGTKATPNCKRVNIVADLTAELLELLGIASFDSVLDNGESKKKIMLSNVVFAPNGTGMTKHGFQFGADTAGPFKFARIKKDGGTVTEARFPIDTSDAEVMARVENWRNGYGGVDGVLKITYTGVEAIKAEEGEAAGDPNQMTIEDAVGGDEPAEPKVSEINAMAERAQARKDARRKGAGVQ